MVLSGSAQKGGKSASVPVFAAYRGKNSLYTYKISKQEKINGKHLFTR